MKLLYFYNDSCGCCKKWKPVLDDLVNEYSVDIDKVNINEDKAMKDEYGITCIPQTLFIDDDGKEVGSILGNMKVEYAKKYFDKYLLNK